MVDRSLITISIRTEVHDDYHVIRKAGAARGFVAMKIKPRHEISNYGSSPLHTVSVSFLDHRYAAEFLMSLYEDEDRMCQFKLFWAGE